MATRPGIDTAIANRLAADHQNTFFAIKAEFDTSDILLWTGTDDLVINSETYTGAGSLINISNVEDTIELKSSGLMVTISGMDTTVLDYALTENYQNRFITLFMGFQMGGSNEVAGVLTLFKGRMTNPTINDTADGATISVNAENRLVDLKRPCNLRYTKNSQKFVDTNDTGFNRVNSIQDMEIIWGREGNTGSAARITGGGNPGFNPDIRFDTR